MDAVLAELRSERPRPVYLFSGQETYFIDRIADYVQNELLPAEEREFNLEVVYSQDVTMRQIIDFARMTPMMGSRRVVLVKEAQQIKKWDDALHYFKQPASHTLLLFFYKHGTPDLRKTCFAQLKASNALFDFPRLYENELFEWINHFVKDKQLTISQQAALMLIECIGSDLYRLSTALERIAMIVPSGGKIDNKIVEKTTGISRNYNIFEFQDALCERNTLKVYRIAQYFADNQKENPLPKILTQLFNFFSNLMLYHYLSDKSQSSVSRELSINPYFVKRYTQASRTFGARKTVEIIRLIRQCDARYKGIDYPSTNQGELLKELIFNMLH